MVKFMIKIELQLERIYHGIDLKFDKLVEDGGGGLGK